MRESKARIALLCALAAGAVLLAVLGRWMEPNDSNRPVHSPPLDVAAAPPTATADPEPAKEIHAYTEGPKSPDGIGKFYMGREISFVMGHQAAEWLERPTREQEERPSLLLENLPLAPDAELADIGAGSGYYAFRIAPKIPQGKVYAVDIQQEMLDLIEQGKREGRARNVETVLGAVDDAKLPARSIDAALLVDVYHEFSHPREMLESIFAALRPGGRVFLLEFRAEDPLVPIKRLHKMTQDQAKKEFAASGFRWVETKDFLPWQHFMIFERPKR